VLSYHLIKFLITQKCLERERQRRFTVLFCHLDIFARHASILLKKIIFSMALFVNKKIVSGKNFQFSNAQGILPKI
jgi:hypothetical protein